MAKTYRELSRKEVKGPDWFQARAAGAADWASRNQKRIAAAALAALVATAAGLGVSAWRGEREERAGALLYRTLEALDGEVSTVPPPGGSRTAFASAADRDRAVIAAAAAAQQEYPSGAAARAAALAAAEAHLRLAEWDAALQSYQHFLAGAALDDSLRFVALEGVARAQEGKGELDQAIRSFERLGVEAPQHKDRAALESARLLARAGKKEEALQVLRSFPDQFKDSPLRPEAAERLRRLGGR